MWRTGRQVEDARSQKEAACEDEWVFHASENSANQRDD